MCSCQSPATFQAETTTAKRQAGNGHAHPMKLCGISDSFDQAEMQALGCQEEAFADEVVAGATLSSTGAVRGRAGAAAGSALLRCPALLKVGSLLSCLHVELGHFLIKADACVVGGIPARASELRYTDVS